MSPLSAAVAPEESASALASASLPSSTEMGAPREPPSPSGGGAATAVVADGDDEGYGLLDECLSTFVDDDDNDDDDEYRYEPDDSEDDGVGEEKKVEGAAVDGGRASGAAAGASMSRSDGERFGSSLFHSAVDADEAAAESLLLRCPAGSSSREGRGDNGGADDDSGPLFVLEGADDSARVEEAPAAGNAGAEGGDFWSEPPQETITETEAETLFSLAHLPSNLHPATSLGIRRVSSMAYFSIGSRLSELDNSDHPYREYLQQRELREQDAAAEGDAQGSMVRGRCSNADLLGLAGGGGPKEKEKTAGGSGSELATEAESSTAKWNAVDVLYHDVMMHVFAFLPLPSLASFSLTSRRANFECFYFLQLQLQGALLDGSPSSSASSASAARSDHDTLPPITGAGAVSRLASMDQTKARELVQNYLESNSTLETLPLSHSLAYLRRALLRGGFHMPGSGSGSSGPGSSDNAAGNAARAAAMAVTLLGAASYMHSNGGVPAEVMNHVPHMSEEYAVALRDGLLKIGLAGGLMRAGAEMAAKVHEGGHGGNGEGEGEDADADADADADTDNGADAHTEDEDEDGGAEGGNDGEGNSQSNAAQGMVAAGVAAQMRETAEQMARMLQSHFPRMHQPAEDAAAQQQQQRAHGGENNESASTAHYAAGVNRSNMAFPSSIAAKLYRAFASSHGQEGEEARHDEDGSGGNNSSEANHSSAAETSDSNDTSPSSLLAPRWRRRHRGQRSHYRPRDGGLSASDASNGGADLVSSAADDASSDEAAPRSAAAEPSPTEVRAMECPVGPDPYGHDVILEGDEGSGADSEDSGTDFRGGSSPDRKQRGLSSSPSSASAAGSDGGGKNPHRKKPSGCVGAYFKSVRAARDEVTSLVKARRKAAFEALPEDERNRISTVFVDACASDATLPVVRELVQLRGVVDVDGFYVGSDGSVTCGLHAAAFHGAAKVVRFLTSPPDLGREGEAPAWPRDNGAPAAGTAPTSSPTYQDGGACNVDLRDANGWTAAHFAAGADTVHVLRVLAERGAELSAEASNGYTPYHWAERLGNIESAAVLREAGADSRFLEVRWMFGGGGGGAAPDFLPAFLANRMRGLVPTGH